MLMLVLGSMMVACVGIVDIIETNVLCCRVDVGVNGVGGVMDVGGVGIVVILVCLVLRCCVVCAIVLAV